MARAPVDVLRGTLDLMILRALQHGARHGYGITRWIHATSGEVFQIEDGALYPALHRLVHRGWIDADWGTSENNRRAKYYSLTAEGRRQLERELHTWERFSGALSKLLGSEEAAR
jgi:transcriptional regulator